MVNSNLQIVQMSENDLLSIKDVLIDNFDDFWSYDLLKEEYYSSTSKYFVAKLDSLIVGFIGIKIILDCAEIMNIVTAKKFRHSGIASSFIKYIISFCEENNIKNINLEVNTKNSIAINLYKKYNFKQVGLRKNYYNSTDDAILMTFMI